MGIKLKKIIKNVILIRPFKSIEVAVLYLSIRVMCGTRHKSTNTNIYNIIFRMCMFLYSSCLPMDVDSWMSVTCSGICTPNSATPGTLMRTATETFRTKSKFYSLESSQFLKSLLTLFFHPFKVTVQRLQETLTSTTCLASLSTLQS